MKEFLQQVNFYVKCLPSNCSVYRFFKLGTFLVTFHFCFVKTMLGTLDFLSRSNKMQYKT